MDIIITKAEKIIIEELISNGKTEKEIMLKIDSHREFISDIMELTQHPEYITLLILSAYIFKELKSQTIGLLNFILNIEIIDGIKPGWKYKTEIIEYEKKCLGKLKEEFKYFIKTNEKIHNNKLSKYGDKEFYVLFENEDFIIMANGESKRTLRNKMYYDFPEIPKFFKK